MQVHVYVQIHNSFLNKITVTFCINEKMIYFCATFNKLSIKKNKHVRLVIVVFHLLTSHLLIKLKMLYGMFHNFFY